MKRGPAISSRVGFLIACTTPQKWPLPLPRSRNQRPPGQDSSFMGMEVPSRVSLYGPSCSSSAVNVRSRDARTRISSFTDNDKLSIPGRVRVMLTSSVSGIRFRTALLFNLGAVFDAAQLMTPEALEGARPFVEWPDGFRVGAIEHSAAVAARAHETGLAEHAKVLRHGRLLELQAVHDVPDRTLLEREKVEDLSPTWLGDGVESVGSGGGARHGSHNTFLYRNTSSHKYGGSLPVRFRGLSDCNFRT